jgi:predicted deacylase
VIAPLSTSYDDARAAFLDAAVAAGARLESFPHPLRGLQGEELFVDVAEVGPAESDGDMEDVVLIVSGTHGVEGYLGSALQRHHLETLDRDRTSGPTLVFVHALNPYGFSWVRRVNEDNVDLNRNFVDWDRAVPTNDDYSELAELLVPSSWTADEQERTLLGLMGKLDELGMERLQQIIQGGQYQHPTGLFYGGTGPTWSHRWLRDFAARRLVGVHRAAIIDLHTGLGPWGHGSLLSSNRPGDAAYDRQVAWWNDVRALDDGESVSAVVAGDWLAAAEGFASATEITGICIEYGTVDGIAVLQSLRADAVMHAHGDPTTPDASAIRDQVRAAFLDDDPAWLEACWPCYHSVVTAAGERLG